MIGPVSRKLQKWLALRIRILGANIAPLPCRYNMTSSAR